MKNEYRIVPKGAYPIMRNCPKCKQKMRFISTNQFRVNANGNRLDCWLIYQCEQCKHTYNLSIYERVDKYQISKDIYNQLLENDFLLATSFGTNHSILQRNKADIVANEIEYEVVDAVYGRDKLKNAGKNGIIIYNPYGIRISLCKVLATILGMPTKEIRTWIKTKQLVTPGQDQLPKYPSGTRIEVICANMENNIWMETRQVL